MDIDFFLGDQHNRRFIFSGRLLTPVIPAINIHPHKIELKAHIGIQVTVKENENVYAYTDNSGGPIPNIIYCRQVNAKQSCDNTNNFEPCLMLPPILQRMDDLHVAKYK